MGGRRASAIGSQCAALPNQQLSFLPSRAQRLFDVLTDPGRGGCDPATSRLVIDPKLKKLARAVKGAVRDAALAGDTLVVGFVGHAETLPDGAGGADLYLMPANGQIPPDSDSGYLLGQRLREVLVTHGTGLDGLILLAWVSHGREGVVT